MSLKWNIATAILLAAVSFLIYQRFTRHVPSPRQMRGGSLPKHRPLEPFLGLDFQTAIRGDLSLLQRYHRQYGDSFRFNPWIIAPSIFTIAPENLKAINTNDNDWGIQPQRLPAMEYFCGRGFLTTDGGEWKAARRSIRPAFAKNKAVDLDIVSNELEKLFHQLPMDDSTVDLQPLLYDMFLNTSLSFLMGVSVQGNSSEAPCTTNDFIESFHSALFWTMIRIVLGHVWTLFPKGRYFKACQRAHDFLDYYIIQGMKRVKSGLTDDNDDGNAHATSLIDHLATSSSDSLFIRSQIIQGMMASQETTSALLGNTLFLLARHPSYWRLIRNEVMPMDDGLSLDWLQDNKVIHNILVESLRLYPVFPLLGRHALRDTTLPVGGGPNHDEPIFVSQGTHIEMSYYALHRDPKVFGQDAEEFRPGRWDDLVLGQWEFMGFGGGSRACLGQQKSLIEAAFVLVKMAQRFDRLESRDARDWKADMKLTCQNANGCKVAFSKG